MNLSSFDPGRVIRQQSGKGAYEAFVPTEVNDLEWRVDDPSIMQLLEETVRVVGELNAFSLILPDIDRYIVMHVAREATVSSRIEGTATTLAEAMRQRKDIRPERRDDWQEVRNYVTALNNAVDRLPSFPLSNRMLRDAHANLMSGVRGEGKTPGEWRRSQNWIGGQGPGSARFVPPPHEMVPGLMGDLEEFLQNDRIPLPHLIRIAIAHYQFETIHPFLDGNGRIGRLLVPLYLIDKGLLQRPSLYLSATLEERRQEYYDRLSAARQKGGLLPWVRFFLEATRDAARDGREKMQAIRSLHREGEEKVETLGTRATDGRRLLDYLFKNPYVTIPETAELIGRSHPTAATLIRDFERLDLLRWESGERPRVFVFGRYFEVYG